MKLIPNIARAAALSLALMFTACESTGGFILPTSIPSIADVQAIAKVCNFIPYEETVTQIISLNDPFLVTANEIAKKICDAIKTPAARAGATPRVYSADGRRSVRIKGQFSR